ncbi:MAG: hypothetical protein JWL62_1644 [Hyphomicrobiales bacterium]|nr:hypothetical protein [Hyphomicrobiales bacterium]
MSISTSDVGRIPALSYVRLDQALLLWLVRGADALAILSISICAPLFYNFVASRTAVGIDDFVRLGAILAALFVFVQGMRGHYRLEKLADLNFQVRGIAVAWALGLPRPCCVLPEGPHGFVANWCRRSGIGRHCSHFWPQAATRALVQPRAGHRQGFTGAGRGPAFR